MYVLTIYLMQAQAGGWTSTNECKQKPNKHEQGQTSTNKNKMTNKCDQAVRTSTEHKGKHE